MPAVINTNVASIIANRNLLGAQQRLSDSVARLSSGLRINSAADDAAGLAVSNQLLAQVNGAKQGIRSLNDMISTAQTAEGSIAAATDMAQRILTLSIQGANGAISVGERKSIQEELKQLLYAIGLITARTKFTGNSLQVVDPRANAGKDVLNYFQTQVGNSSNDKMILSSYGFRNVGGNIGIATGATTAAAVGADSTLTIDAKTLITDAVVGLKVYSRTVAGGNIATNAAGYFNSANAATTTLLGTVKSVATSATGGDTTITITAEKTGGILVTDVIANGVVMFSGLATNENTDPSTGTQSIDRTLAEAIFNPVLTSNTVSAQDATAAFQIVQKTANNYVLELGRQRAFLGAAMNQMDYTLQNITDLASNLEQARSRVIDTDYAAETSALTRGQILQQAATAMLAQANQMPNVILTLLK